MSQDDPQAVPPPWERGIPHSAELEQNEEVEAAQKYNAIPTQFINSYGIRYDSRVLTATKLNFLAIMASTERAILLELMHPVTGEILEEWFPKKICQNLDEGECTILVWNQFLNDQKQHLFDEE